MSDKDYLDWYKNDLDLEARIEQRLKALEKKNKEQASNKGIYQQTCRNLDIDLCPNRECPCEAFESIEKASGGEKLRAKSVLQSHMSSQSQCGGIENSKPPTLIYPERDFVPKPPEQVGIIREIKGDEASIEIIDKTITDTQGRIWIHPKLLIAEFIQKLRTYLGCETCTSSVKPNTCKSCSDLYPIIEEYEAKLK